MSEKIIARGWPAEYGGPRDVLGQGYIPWAGRPEIQQAGTGRWQWVCSPQFVNDAAFADLKLLADNGWRVFIRSAGTALRVRIEERES